MTVELEKDKTWKRIEDIFFRKQVKMQRFEDSDASAEAATQILQPINWEATSKCFELWNFATIRRRIGRGT